MHANANMVFELNETRLVCETVLKYQDGGARLHVSSINNDEIVFEMIAKIRNLIVTKIVNDNCRKELFCVGIFNLNFCTKTKRMILKVYKLH